MATLEQIAEGIRRAHAAGNAEDVRKLGAAYRQMQAQQAAAQPSETAPEPVPSPAGSVAVPPAGLKPGSKEYALWARDAALAGNKLPMVSAPPQEYDGPAPYSDIGSKLHALSGSMIEGVPIAGPTLIDWAKQGRAAMQGMSPEAVDAEFARAKEANPITSGAGSVAGAVLPLAGLGTLPGLGRVLGMTGGLPSQMGFGLVSGAGIGAADTAARGGSADDIARNAMIGAAGGGLLPIATNAIGAGVKTLLGKNVPKGVDTVGRAMRDDGIDPMQLPRLLGDTGEGAMVMDLGPNLQSLAGGISALPGKGQKVLREAIGERALPAAKRARVEADVAATIGTGPDIDLLKQSIVQQQKAASDPLYAAIRDIPVPAQQGNFGFVFGTPMGKEALQKGLQMAANDGVRFQSRGLTAGMVDYTKRALDDIAKEAARQGKDNLARQAGNLARVLRTEADKVVPGYKQAREAFAGPAAVLDAIDEGAAAFTKDVSPGQLERMLQAMSASERDAYLQGVQTSLEAQMGNAVNDVVSLRNMFRKGWNEDKLRILLGDDIADDVLKRIDREMTYGTSTNVVSSNSETARRQAVMRTIDPQAKDLSQTSWFGAVLEGINLARRKIAGNLQGKSNADAANILKAGARSIDPAMLPKLAGAGLPRLPSPIAPGAAAVGSGAGPNRKEPLLIQVFGGRN